VVRRVSPGQRHPSGAAPLAKKPNYDFEKRRKEMDRKAKKEAREQRKLDNPSEDTTEIDAQTLADLGVKPVPQQD